MNGERIRQGAAGLCVAGLLLIGWLLVKPDHEPGLGDAYIWWNLAGLLQGVGIIVGVASLVVLIVGLLKAPPA